MQLYLRVYDGRICYKAKIHSVLLEVYNGAGCGSNRGNSGVSCDGGVYDHNIYDHMVYSSYYKN